MIQVQVKGNKVRVYRPSTSFYVELDVNASYELRSATNIIRKSPIEWENAFNGISPQELYSHIKQVCPEMDITLKEGR